MEVSDPVEIQRYASFSFGELRAPIAKPTRASSGDFHQLWKTKQKYSFHELLASKTQNFGKISDPDQKFGGKVSHGGEDGSYH